jgi:hypothetical protein
VLLQRSNFTTTGVSGKRESDGYRRLRRAPMPAGTRHRRLRARPASS